MVSVAGHIWLSSSSEGVGPPSPTHLSNDCAASEPHHAGTHRAWRRGALGAEAVPRVLPHTGSLQPRDLKMLFRWTAFFWSTPSDSPHIVTSVGTSSARFRSAGGALCRADGLGCSSSTYKDEEALQQAHALAEVIDLV